jgi:catechol 2,3-dioxygenase-like lactoylglutathione lyase family enzyme
MKLNHLHIAVPDVAKARKFYEDFFGMTVAFEHGEGVFLTDESGFLLAIDPLGDGESVQFPDWYHHGFCVDSAAKVKEIFLRMKAGGVDFVREYKEFDDLAASFFCWSPGPLKLEVSWNKD